MNKGLPLLIAAIVMVCAPGIPAAADVSGTWDLTVETPQGTASPSVSLVQSGEKLSGTYRGRLGEYPLEGTMRGNEIRFSVTVRFQDQSLVVTYSGTAQESTMSGTVQFGDRGSGTWSGKRRSN